jgi:diadenosine tetraphosphate (Ap4A) HIT family hydrolase
VPVNSGGEDSLHNYQALCYKCNATKRDCDDTDFRKQGEIYKHREHSCVFCSIDPKRIISDNNLAYITEDKYPVTIGHCLIIPKRHFDDYFDITQAELNSVQALLQEAKKRVISKDKSVLAFNLGINNGTVAGQTILHAHIHLIPRRAKDVELPTGGIRNIIPGKGNYAR